MRGEGAIAGGDAGHDLELEGLQPLADIGGGFGDLPEQRKDGRPDLALISRWITAPQINDERALPIGFTRFQ